MFGVTQKTISSTTNEALPCSPNFRPFFNPNRQIITALSVRTLFDAILKEMPNKYGNKIIMSAINIDDMRTIAMANGFEIISVDIDPLTLSPKPGALISVQKKSGAKICLITHLFGATNPLTDAMILKKKKVFIIEDAAQAFAGSSYKGNKDADCSLFSFGPIKRHTALGGAIASFNNLHKTFFKNIENRLKNHPQKSDFWFRKRAAKYIFLKLMTKPTIYALLIFLIARSGKNVDETVANFARGFSGQSLLTAIRHQPPIRLLQLLERRLIDAEQTIASENVAEIERQTICQNFLKNLDSELSNIGCKASAHTYWLLALNYNTPKTTPEFVMQHLRDNGFDATRGATSMRAIDDENTPSASKMLKNILYVPNPAQLNPKAREGLIKHIKDITVL